MIAETKKKFQAAMENLQKQIIAEMKKFDPALNVQNDPWDRTDFVGNPGGGGLTCALTGKVFENAGVNTSTIFGKVNPQFAANLKGQGDELWASGISLILHPFNPKIPTVHANFRMIVQGDTYWFGGGADLTPFYPHEEDFVYFHKTWQKACAPYNCFEAMKKECDGYFVNHHRKGEMRGVGGIFFDHYNSGNLEADFNRSLDLSSYFIESYFPLVKKRISETYSDEDEKFQLYRRGRYVEFNLLHDRGTHFGLKTNGRTESILISLPARCRFGYHYQPAKNSPYAKMMEYYYPNNWVDFFKE